MAKAGREPSGNPAETASSTAREGWGTASAGGAEAGMSRAVGHVPTALASPNRYLLNAVPREIRMHSRPFASLVRSMEHSFVPFTFSLGYFLKIVWR